MRQREDDKLNDLLVHVHVVYVCANEYTASRKKFIILSYMYICRGFSHMYKSTNLHGW
jgi:hypothetical protein